MADAAFVIVIAKGGGSRRVPSSVTSEDLGFAPTGSGSWRDEAGRIDLQVWSGPRRTIEGSLATSGRSATFVVGDVRRSGAVWPDHRTWSYEVAEAAAALGPCGLQRELRGVYAVGSLRDDGHGWIVTDPLGLRCLYVGEDEDVFVVATRAALVAKVLHQERCSPKDAEAVSWLAFTSYWVGDRTGYAGVSTAPPGSVLRIDPSGARWGSDPALELRAIEPGERSVEEVVPELVEDIADSLNAVLARPAQRHVIQLTGGKDSRVLLAVAMAAGIADRFTYLTSGPDNLPDVQIATELAERFGLRHEVRFLGSRPAGSDIDRWHRWVSSTAGMMSAWEAPGTEPSDDILVSGVYGEFMRYFQVIPPSSDACADGRRWIGRLNPGRAGLLQPEVARCRRAEFLDAVRPAAAPPGDPFREVQFFYAYNRIRFTRAGPRLELSPEERVLPLYSPVALKAAMALDHHARHSSLVALGIMRHCDARLAHHRLASPGWDEQARQILGRQPEAPIPPHAAALAAPHHPKKQSLTADLHATGSSERDDLMTDLLADTRNPAWDFLDRAAFRAGVDAWPTLDLIQRREIFGAASAAIWLAR